MSRNNKRKKTVGLQQGLIQPINTGSILSDSNYDIHLIGKAPTTGDFYDGLVIISSFLRQHQFLSADNSSGASASVSMQSYGQLIKDFEKSQLERQRAGLRTNTSGASAADLQKIVDCHCKSLEHGLEHVALQDSWLEETNLHAIHAKLCPDDAHSGQYRENKVRASNTLFTRPEHLKEEFNKFSVAAQRFQTKFAASSSAAMDEQQWVNYVYEKISFVAIVLFGINDIHPFRDGNGRTARIYMNIALKRILGLPFPVTVTAQVEQRREYIDALKECRSRLQSISKGENVLQEGQSVFEHLIVMVADRVLHAVVEVNSLVELKAQSAAVEEEARVARRFREKAAAGQCCICLDDHPNISTLCCGQAVHMICLMEWLSNQGSCITCRNPMPRITPRTVRQQVPPANAALDEENNEEPEITEEDTETIEETTEDAEVASSVEDSTTEDYNDNDTTEDLEVVDEESTEDYNDTTEDVEVANSPVNNDTTEDNNDTTEDTTSVDNYVQQEDIDTTEDTTEDTTVVDAIISQSSSRFCGQCNTNKFAVDCSNSLCGRCCQIYGSGMCVRHNNW